MICALIRRAVISFWYLFIVDGRGAIRRCLEKGSACAFFSAAQVFVSLFRSLAATGCAHDVAFLYRPPSLGNLPAVIDDTINCYFRPEGIALILAAGEDESIRNEPPDTEDQTPTPNFLNNLIDNMIKRVPKIEESGLHSIHVGRDGLTPDQRPIFGAAGPAGFYLACGLSGTGFKISPAVGASMSELILDGKSKTVDINLFRFERFAEGKLIKGEYEYGHIWK